MLRCDVPGHRLQQQQQHLQNVVYVFSIEAASQDRQQNGASIDGLTTPKKHAILLVLLTPVTMLLRLLLSAQLIATRCRYMHVDEYVWCACCAMHALLCIYFYTALRHNQQ